MPLEQVPFGTNDFAVNPEPRLPCVLLLDVSTSMTGKPIHELNDGVFLYKGELVADTLASKRVEVALVTFGGIVRTLTDFTTADAFNPPHLQPDGDTPLGAALEHAMALVGQRKQAYRDNGIAYFRPWIFLITDGAPTDEWKRAAEKVKMGEEMKAFAFFAVGVEGADFNVLKQIGTRPPLKLQGLKFRELFQWLSNSQRSVSHSTPQTEDRIQLANPLGPGGWASLG
jgi:uncharacterized protein YegL